MKARFMQAVAKGLGTMGFIGVMLGYELFASVPYVWRTMSRCIPKASGTAEALFWLFFGGLTILGFIGMMVALATILCVLGYISNRAHIAISDRLSSNNRLVNVR